MIGNRQAGMDTQLAVVKLIEQPTSPATDTGAPQIYNLDGVGAVIKDTSGIVTPLAVGSGGAGVVEIEFADSPYQVLATTRVVLVDTTGGAISALLPLAASIQRGVSITFVDQARNFGTSALTIDGNGKNINGASTLVLNTTDALVTLYWGGVTWEYRPTFGMPIVANATGAIGAATCFPTTAGGAVSATEVAIGIATRTGILRNLYTSLVTAPGGTDTVAFTVRKSSDNGATWSATTLTCTTTGTAKGSSDTTHTPAVTAGDLLSVQMVSSAATAATPFVGFEIYGA